MAIKPGSAIGAGPGGPLDISSGAGMNKPPEDPVSKIKDLLQQVLSLLDEIGKEEVGEGEMLGAGAPPPPPPGAIPKSRPPMNLRGPM